MKRAPMAPNRGHYAENGRAFLATAAPALPPRTAHFVRHQTVPCPDCKAGIGEPCTGLAHSRSHRVRERLATRADNAAREAAGTLGPASCAPGTREDPNGGLCPSCGLRIKLTPRTSVLASHTTKGGWPDLKKGRVPCLGSNTQPVDEEPSDADHHRHVDRAQ